MKVIAIDFKYTDDVVGAYPCIYTHGYLLVPFDCFELVKMEGVPYKIMQLNEDLDNENV